MAEKLSQSDRSNKGAIGALSIAFHRKYGDEALPIIEGVLESHVPYDMPQVREMKGKGMKGLAELFSKYVEIKAATDEVVHFVTGGACQFGLYDTHKRLCEAMMIFDRKIVETIVGQKLDMEIIKTVASGDKFCEVKFTIP